MRVRFISSFAVITERPAESRRLYVEALGLPLAAADGQGHRSAAEAVESLQSASRFRP